MITVGNIFDLLCRLAPLSQAESWDNPGLLIGNREKAVSTALVALDCTREEIKQAKALGAELIITHHPVIFHPLKAVTADSVCYLAVQNHTDVISMHTNLDKALGVGVNDVLCKTLHMNFEKLPQTVADGFLNIGTIPGITEIPQLISLIKKSLNGAVRYCETTQPITKIGVCAGAGADFIKEAIAYGCNTYITGDASYHNFLDAQALGVTLIAAGHFETEVMIVDAMMNALQNEFPEVRFVASTRKNPIITEI